MADLLPVEAVSLTPGMAKEGTSSEAETSW